MRLRLLLLLVTMTLCISTPNAEARQIWLTPLDPVWRAIHQWPANDFMELFDGNSPWEKAASVINVFEISKRFALEASDADLTRAIGGLHRRNIALAIQGTPLVASAECGLGVEGHGPPHDMLAVAQRLRSLGADLRYIVFDEPLYYGHEFGGSLAARACQSPIGMMAEQAATKVAEVRGIFPAVQVGGVEPFGIPEKDGLAWAADLEEWLKAYAAAAGRPLAFLRADIVWGRSIWRSQIQNAASVLRSLRVPLSVVYNGLPDVTSDEEWTKTALRNAHIVECELRITPDQIAFQSWADRPRRMLPETEPGTLTNLILRYLADRKCA